MRLRSVLRVTAALGVLAGCSLVDDGVAARDASPVVGVPSPLGAKHRLSMADSIIETIRVSPDDRRVAAVVYSVYSSGPMAVTLIEDGSATVITPPDRWVTAAAWNPDSERLLVAWHAWAESDDLCEARYDELVEIDLDGNVVRTVPVQGQYRFRYGLEFTADTTRVLGSIGGPGCADTRGQLVSVDIGTGVVATLRASESFSYRYPRFDSSTEHLVVEFSSDDVSTLASVDLDGSSDVRLVPEGWKVQAFAMARTTGRIVFYGTDPDVGDGRVWTLDLAGKPHDLEAVLGGAGVIHPLELSPDGSRLYAADLGERHGDHALTERPLAD